MGNWKECVLGDILTFQRGHDLPKSQITVGGYPVVGSNGIIGYHNAYTTEEPSITIGRSGNTGNPFIVYGRSWSHNTTLYVKEFKDSDPVFVYYLLKTLDLGNFAGGSAVPTLNRNHIHTLEISVPPFEKQVRIGHTLRALDDKIERNNAINHNLEQTARAIFKSWFVDFEPWGGVMPSDWREVEFSSFLTPRVEKSSNPTIPLFSVTDTGIFPRGDKFNKALSKATTMNKIAHQTDLVFGMSREILNWGVLRAAVGGVSSAYNVFAIADWIDSRYLESFIKAHSAYFKDLIRPATREGQGVDKGALMLKSLYLPPSEILDEYYSLENSLMKQIETLSTDSANLATVRDTLLPKLMSGELTIDG
ncbi:hypothetical protein FACS189490_05920 [Clostridia bacterium]|nr:hypothetical protein FACS189490_05920 [Clostridia bacterium]